MKKSILILFAALCCASAFAQEALLPIPRQQFLDINGHPLAGGKVYTYVAGSSTPQPTFTDATGLVQQPNPVILDAGGFASIWLGPLYYKVVVTDSADVLQYTTDNVSSYNLPFVTSWSFTEGSGCVGAANYDVLCGIAATHRLAMVNNNGAQDLVVGQTTTDLLTNKSLTSPIITTPSIDTPTITGPGTAILSRLTSSNTTPALSGWLRLIKTDQLCWRNNANSTDVCVALNGSDQIALPAFTAPSMSLTGNASTTGLFTAYNGFALVGNGIPVEVAAVDLTGQTAAVTTTNIFTVAAAGQYRVSWNAKITTAAASSSTLGALTIVYTDPDGVAVTLTAPATIAAGTIATTSTANTTGTVLIGMPLLLNCKATSAITYAFSYASNVANTMTYNLHIHVDAL